MVRTMGRLFLRRVGFGFCFTLWIFYSWEMMTCCSLENVSLNIDINAFWMQVTKDPELHYQSKCCLYNVLWDH